MKTKLIIAIFLLTSASYAQQINTRKFIEVTGSAEMTVQPDEVDLELTLGDYLKNEKVGDEFKAVLKKHNIKPESVKYQQSSEWYWWHWWQYGRTMNAQTVRVTLDKNTDILKFVKDLDRTWTQSIRIVDTRHKDMVKFRKEVKMEAMKAAKEKANYLLESVGEKLGGILSAEEIPEASQQSFYWNNNIQNQISNSYVARSSGSSDDGMDNAKALKLRYEFKVKFQIQ